MANKSTPLLVAVATLMLAIGGCASSDNANSMKSISAPDFAASLRGRVTTDAMMAHLTKLQDIANANNNTRAVGTPGYDASVDYVVGKLRDKGFDVQTMQFEAHVFHAEPGDVTVADKKFDARGDGVQHRHPTGRGDRSAGRLPGRRKPGLRRRGLRPPPGQRRRRAGGPRYLPVRAEGGCRGAARRRWRWSWRTTSSRSTLPALLARPATSRSRSSESPNRTGRRCAGASGPRLCICPPIPRPSRPAMWSRRPRPVRPATW